MRDSDKIKDAPSVPAGSHGVWGLGVCILFCSLAVRAGAQPASDQAKEYQVKIVFVVKFLKFIDWPKTPQEKKDLPFEIAVIGKVPIGEGTKEIPDASVNGRKVVMTVLHEWKEGDDQEAQKRLLADCEVLFLARSEETHTDQILPKVIRQGVLTVGEAPGFLTQGGIFRFELEDNKVRFSVDLKNANKAELTIQSSLLRLATQVYK